MNVFSLLFIKVGKMDKNVRVRRILNRNICGKYKKSSKSEWKGHFEKRRKMLNRILFL